jgi:hypothetical protein
MFSSAAGVRKRFPLQSSLEADNFKRLTLIGSSLRTKTTAGKPRFRKPYF